jgi:nucleotide-binding universal stress UspA family protein
MAEPTLNRIKRTATRQGVRYTVVSVEAASPARTIIAVAEKTGCDLIIMASHGRGRLARFLFGNETTRVLAQCKIPALVYR